MPEWETQLPMTIAIDGPAASGKSTLAIALASRLGYLYFDTGVMYRAITWVALQKGVNLADETQLAALAETVVIDVRPPSRQDGRFFDVWVDHQDITWQIRQSEVDANVSVVSAYAGVRAALSAQQRRIGQRGQVVMAGRDIGTVVLPEAELKIYLDASAEERARRRTEEIRGRGGEADFEKILAMIRERDRIDSTRAIAPLRPAEDAILINSSEFSAQQVLQMVLTIIAGRQKAVND